MKQFEVDEKKRLKFMLTQHKKHPKWKKRAWVRRMLLVFFLISSTWIGIVGYMQNSNRGISMFILGFTGMGLITIVPYIIYYFALRQTCRSGVDYKTKETLILTDSEFINTYLHINAKRYYKYQRDTFKYTKIQRIIYNEYHEFLDIYGYYKKIWYRDYFKNIIGTERGIRDKNNKLRLFLYYDNNEELINTLVEKSNVKLETVNHPQE